MLHGQHLEINILKVYSSVRRESYGLQQQFLTRSIHEVTKLALVMSRKTTCTTLNMS